MNIPRLFFAFVLALLTLPAMAGEDTTFAAGLGGGNAACGSFEPVAFADYDRDHDVLPAHVNAHVGPNGSCAGQGVAIDAQVAYRHAFGDSDSHYAVVTAGFDRHTIAFEYVSAENDCPAGFKCFSSVAVEAPELSFGWGARVADNWTVEVAYNAIDTPLGDGSDLFPLGVSVSGVLQDFEIELSVLDEGIVEFDATRNIGKFQIGARVANNAHRLEHPAPTHISGLARAGGPNPVYSFDVGLRF